MGAVIMSPALGIYGHFDPMVLTAGKSTSFVFALTLLATLPTTICYAMLSEEILSSSSAYAWLWEVLNPAMGIWIGWLLSAFFIIIVFLLPLLFSLFFNDLGRLWGSYAVNGTFLFNFAFCPILIVAITYCGVEFSEKSSLIDLIIQMVIVTALAITIIIALAVKGKLAFTPFLRPSSPKGVSGISSDVIPVVHIARLYLGMGDLLIIITGMIADLGVHITTVVGASRVLYPLAGDGALPVVLGKLIAWYKTPWNALQVILFITFIFVSFVNPVFYNRYHSQQFSLFWNCIIGLPVKALTPVIVIWILLGLFNLLIFKIYTPGLFKKQAVYLRIE